MCKYDNLYVTSMCQFVLVSFMCIDNYVCRSEIISLYHFLSGQTYLYLSRGLTQVLSVVF